MSGTVIENLSSRKLSAILVGLLICQIGFFLIGAWFAPDPSTSMEFLMTRCKDKNAGTTREWFYIRPQPCDVIADLDRYHSVSDDARDIVFVAQMPHARMGVQLEYSPWFQQLAGFLDVEIQYDFAVQTRPEDVLLEMEVRMAYRGHDDGPTEWHNFISTTVQRRLYCTIDTDKRKVGYVYNCSTLDLFELGASGHPFYLLNIRLPVNATRCRIDRNAPNCAIGLIYDMRLIVAHQTGGFTAVWFTLKTLVSPLAILATCWYYRRIELLNRRKFLLEKSILALGLALVVLDFPFEWISLVVRAPVLLLLSDLRQGLFYTVLFSFWLIFAGEHLIDCAGRNSLKNYWRNLSLVGVASTALLLYDLSERGRRLADPFFSVWTSPRSSSLAHLSIVVAGALIALYFVFLTFKIYRVWTTIQQKRATQYHHLSEMRRLKIESIIFRFKFLMIVTLVCAASTIVSYFMHEYEDTRPFDDLTDDDHVTRSSFLTHSASAFFTGTFGMWNIYVCLLLFMYAPSHKRYAVDAQALEDENEDFMDPKSSTESTPMTTFLKAATD